MDRETTMPMRLMLAVLILAGCNADKAQDDLAIQVAQLRDEVDTLRAALVSTRLALAGTEQKVEGSAVVLGQAADLLGYCDRLRAVVRVTDDNDVVFENANVYVQSGSGATDGDVNGKGNLIVGYDELRDEETTPKTGSHNLIVGQGHSYTSYAGVVFGSYNQVGAHNASVLGGVGNSVEPFSGAEGVVVGGASNRVSGQRAVVVGGALNTGSAYVSVVVGGDENEASGERAVALGGWRNTAADWASVALGGHEVTAYGDYSLRPKPTSGEWPWFSGE